MKLTKAQREQLKNKFGGRCAYCGEELSGKWHADHIEAVKRDFDMKKCEKTGYMIPVSNGVLFKPENDTLENMNPSCVPCNINKSSMSLEFWRRSIAHYRDVQLLRDSTHARHLHRFGLIEIIDKPVVFFFETYLSGTPQAILDAVVKTKIKCNCAHWKNSSFFHGETHTCSDCGGEVTI